MFGQMPLVLDALTHILQNLGISHFTEKASNTIKLGTRKRIERISKGGMKCLYLIKSLGQ